MDRLLVAAAPGLAACLLLLGAAAPAGAQTTSGETPVSVNDIAGQPAFSLPSLPASLTDDPSRRLVINGFAVASYGADFNSKQNSFSDDALALSLYKAFSDRLSVFVQLTSSRGASSPFLSDVGSSRDIATDIDNLQLTVRASSTVDITFGKFDSPLAIERDDAPLNFQATSSFTFDFTRPVKFTGVVAHAAFSPELEGWAVAANGWDNDVDNNKGKTGALYGLWSPSLAAHVGLGFIAGPENDGTSKGTRKAAVATFLFQPREHLLLGGESVAGSDVPSGSGGATARWYGDMLFVHQRFGGHWAATLRLDTVDDPAGARTGTPQRLSSLTLSPQYLVGGGFFGIFHTLDRTTLRLPELALRLDLRFNHSDQPVFVSGTEGAGTRNNRSATLQTVVIF